MRLWNKVFLCVLALTVLAILLTAQVVVSLSFESRLAGEMDRSVAEHSFVYAGISNRFSYLRAREGAVFLGDQSVEEAFVEVAAGRSGGEGGMAVYREGERIASANLQFEPRAGQLYESLVSSPLEEQEVRTVIREERSGQYYGVAVSVFAMEGVNYELYTTRDLTFCYRERDAQYQRIQWILSLLSPVVAAVLWLMLRLFLSPLGRINHTLQAITQGEYSLRLEEKGPREFRELSHNLNTMTGAVQETVIQVQELADGRKQFIDNFAHEMKTPLTSILGFGDLLRVKRVVSDQQRREYAGVIVEEAKRLQNLSGKLLELAMTDHTDGEFVPVEMGALFREIAPAMVPLAAARGVKLLCRPCEVTLWCDKELMKSLLFNLTDNAMKASPEGGEVLLSCAAQEAGVVLSVQDQGIGMDAKTVRKATEAFYMGDKSRSRKHGGAGLGLALCARIAQLHGATLEIDSLLGSGTTVNVKIPGRGPGGKTEEA